MKVKASVYQSSGAQQGTMELPADLFAAPVHEALMQQAVLLRRHNARRPIAHVKSRSEVVGSTQKLFRQKGTGNARRGSRYTNLLRGGGGVHTPTSSRNFSVDMPKKQRRQALFSSLSVQASSGNVFVLESWKSATPKTKEAAQFLTKAPAGKRYLLVVDQGNQVLEKAFSNLPAVKIIRAEYLNPYDVLWADQVCLLSSAVEVAQNTFCS